MAKHPGAGQMPQNSFIPEDRGLGRRVDRRQESYAPSPYAAQRVLPHGDVSPEGDRAWPEPSLTSRVLVYGGAAVAAAAVTAGAVLAVRKVADIVSGNDEVDRDADRAAERAAERARKQVYDSSRGRSSAPAFAAMPEREREAMRARARSQAAADDARRQRMRDEAKRSERPARAPEPGRRPPRPAQAPQRNLLGEIEHTAQTLTRNINGIVGAVTMAMAAFRSVANQAEGVVREFHGTADQIRGFLGTAGAGRPEAPRASRPSDPFRATPRRDVVDLRDANDARPSTAAAAQADAPRMHRL